MNMESKSNNVIKDLCLRFRCMTKKTGQSTIESPNLIESGESIDESIDESINQRENSFNDLKNMNLPDFIIIDCSMFSYIDTSGIAALKAIVLQHKEIGMTTYLAGCPVHITKMLEKDGFYKEVTSNQQFISIHDAVVHAFDKINQNSNKNDVTGSSLSVRFQI